MTAALLAANGSKTLWYLTRGSGAVTLVLLTVSMSLGIVGTFRWRSSLLPRFSSPTCIATSRCLRSCSSASTS